jgi:lipoate-protein ligase B
LLRPGVLDYQRAWQLQQRAAESVRAGRPAHLILLQHPPTYTLGVRGRSEHILLDEAILQGRGAAVVRSDRGGDVTFHGPGQIVGYPIVDLRAMRLGAADYVRALEEMLIAVARSFGIEAGRSERNPGVWVGDAKLAAIGVRVSRGVTTHGFALNVSTDLAHFDAIVPCGLRGAGVTSMEQVIGRSLEIDDVEDTVASTFGDWFGFDVSAGEMADEGVAIAR